MEAREGKLLTTPTKMNNPHAVDAVAECADLWAQANPGKRIYDPCEGAVSQVIGRHIDKAVEELRADRDRLQAIVDKLPETADGVPVVPYMMVYIRMGSHIDERRVIGPQGRAALNTDEPATHGTGGGQAHRLLTDCYSTRKAAEAAAKENA